MSCLISHIKIKFFSIILISLTACTVFTDRKNVDRSIPGKWDLKLITDLDTLDLQAEFILENVNGEYFSENFYFTDKNDSLIYSGGYVFTGFGSHSFLIAEDTNSRLNFRGEMTDFKYRKGNNIENRPIKYVEFVDTLETTSVVMKFQMTTIDK